MRKLLLSLLLASAVATPALAGPGDESDRQQMRAQRQQMRQERQQQSDQNERPHFDSANVENSGDNDRQSMRRSPRFQQNIQQNSGTDAARMEAWRAARIQRIENGNAQDTARDWRRNRRNQVQSGDLQQPARPLPNLFRHRPPVISDIPRVGTQPPMRVDRRRTPEVRWSSNWRNDHRYDWRNWRDRHRSWFHFGFYSDPFGWGYQPYSIGWRMWPSYYGSSYWLNDPWQYRLPYAPPGTRWIRYYDDAILVDTWNGQVVDVIYNFFW